MSIDRSNVRGLVRAVAYDLNGARLGRVAQVFLDDRSDQPAWVAVDVTRVRGMRLLPLAGAAMKGRHLVIRAERSTVRSAPRIDLGDGQLSSQDESRLLEHYGLVSDRAAPNAGGQRPESPWPDDTEREMAWERPAQWQAAATDTQPQSSASAPVAPAPIAQGWDQQPEGPGEIGDRATLRTRDGGMPEPAAREPEPAAGSAQAAAQAPAAAPVHPNAAPSNTVEAPAPPSVPTPESTPTAPSTVQSPSEPANQARTAQTAAIPRQRVESATVPEPRPDGETTSR